MATPCIVPPMHVAAGTGRVVAGRYYLQDPIGRGAMGTVWRARDALLARDVAVKEVLLRGASTPEDTRVRYERTLREARTAARLNHPAVVTIFDVVEADGRPWIVMELVQARSLEQILAEDGPLPPHQAADAGVRLLGALATAHAAGILHRDVKPSNVLLSADGRAVLTDFGIATLEGDPGLTQVGMVMGTPGFTAPERIRGEPATPASDLWSLGATLYAAVDGHGPFDHRGSSLAILSVIANEDAPRARSAGALGPAIDALLRRDPRARPDAATAGRLLSAAVMPPTGNSGNESPGSGGLRDAFQGGAFRGGALHADAIHGDAFHGGAFRDEGFLGAAFPDRALRSGAVTDRAFHGQALRDDPFPGNAFHSDLYGLASEGTSPGSRPTTPQPPALELPAWMSFPPSESPPEGIGLLAGTPPHPPMDVPPSDVPPMDTPPMDTPEDTAIPGPMPLPRPRTPGTPGALGTGFLRPAGHAPGRHGAQADGYRRWVLMGLGALAIVCAGILAGLAIGHSGHSSLPAGYQQYTVPAAQTGTTAGFTMAVPDGWRAGTHGLVTDVVDPVGHSSIQVDLAPFEAGSAFGEASFLEEQAVTDGSFPGYRRVELRSLVFHGNPGAAWEFTWQKPGTGRVGVLDVLFKGRAGARPQAYQIQVSAQGADRVASRAIFAEVLRTFAPR
jgi:tRNA A-37 threonylcarbamoyl transferase component Bud32